MPTPKKKSAPVRALKDLKPNKNPQGGALDAYLVLKGQKQGSIKSP